MIELVVLIISLGSYSLIYLYSEYRIRKDYETANKKYQEWLKDLLKSRYF